MISNPLCNLTVITGPTASGKTRLATLLAARINGEIISADSRQVYRRMDLGTGKDYDDYRVDNQIIPYHLIDIREPGYKYNVYEFQNDFFRVFEAIQNKGKYPIMCGGTGLYIQAVLDGYKMVHVPPNPDLRKSLGKKSLEDLKTILTTFKQLHNNTDTDTIPRAIRSIEIETYYLSHPEIEVELPPLTPLIVGVKIDRELRREKITRRLQERLKEGMVEEIEQLLSRGLTPNDLVYYGLEYKYLTLYVTGQLSYQEMFEKLNIAIHQFAKRQMTWFRGMERKGHLIRWVDAVQPADKNVEIILRWMKDFDPKAFSSLPANR